MLVGQLARLGVQAAYLVVIAKSLGPADMGVLVAVLSVVNIVAPFCGLGTGQILVKYAARSPELFHRLWGNALVATVVTAVAGTLIIAGPGRELLLPTDAIVPLVLTICVADLLLARVIDLAGLAFQAMHKPHWIANLQLSLSSLRLGAAVLFTRFDRPSLISFGLLYLAATAIVASICILIVKARFGAPKLAVTRLAQDSKEGLFFSMSLSAQSIYNDIDKTMLAKMATPEAAGIYFAGYRIIDMAYAPVRSVLMASYSRLFQQATGGMPRVLQFIRPLLSYSLLYAIVAGLALLILAPVAEWVLGPGYQEVTRVIRLLSVIPVLRAASFFAADALTATGHQPERTAIQVGVACLNVVLNFFLIRALSWTGAVYSSVLCDATLAAALWILVFRRRTARAAEPDGILRR